MDIKLNTPYRMRDGRRAVVVRKGHVSNNVLVGCIENGPITVWHSSGRWRWDGTPNPWDLVEPLEGTVPFVIRDFKSGQQVG